MRVAARRARIMAGLIAILAAVLSGLGALGVWAIPACAIALGSTSYAEHYHLYQRGRELGLASESRDTLAKSFANALVAASCAYAGGWLLRLMT